MPGRRKGRRITGRAKRYKSVEAYKCVVRLPVSARDGEIWKGHHSVLTKKFKGPNSTSQTYLEIIRKLRWQDNHQTQNLKKARCLQGEPSYELLLIWDRCYWTLKNSAKIVNKLIKVESELARLYRTPRWKECIHRNSTPTCSLFFMDLTGHSQKPSLIYGIIREKQKLLQETQQT